MDRLPLDGVRVADFTWVVGGPIGTLLLATLGAEVIKIETRLRPDPMRDIAPFIGNVRGVNRSWTYNTVNINKKACTINLSHPRGVQIAKDLIKISDVVLDNFSGDVMERLGLGYQVLKKIKPELIVASLSGLGRTGPSKDAVAYGMTIHAYSGLNSLTGYLDEKPRPMGHVWIDPLSGVMAAIAIGAALHHRDKTGEGQYIEISMCEAFLPQISEALMDYGMNKRVQKPRGNRDDSMVPHGLYRCQGEDKWVAIAVSNEDEWKSLCRILKKPKWTEEDNRFSNAYSRCQNQDELDKLIEGWTSKHTAYEVMEMLQKAGVPCAPCMNAEELFADSHMRERDFFKSLDYEGEELSIAGLPWKCSYIESAVYQRSPFLGEHNEYVFSELLHIPRDEIAQLEEEKIIC